MKGYWKIGLQQGPVNTMRGWGTLVHRANAYGRSVYCAASDATPADIQSNSLNKGNFIATHDNWNQRFDFDHKIYSSSSVAHEAWKINARNRWILFKERLPTDHDPYITAVSIENEQRGWVGWKQENDSGPILGQIPGFTGWADCEGWQAYYTALEVLKEAGYRYFAFAYSSGLPEYRAWEQPGMKEFLKLCSISNGRIGVALHEYSLNDDLFATVTWGDKPSLTYGDHIFRFQKLHESCRRMGISYPKIQIKEFGYHQKKLSPSQNQTKQQLLKAAEIYAQFPNIEGIALWTAATGWKPVNEQVENLIPWLSDMYATKEWEIDDTQPPVDPPVDPVDKIKFVEFIYPQEATKELYDKITDIAWTEYKRTTGGSVDHAIAALESDTASSESYAVVWEPSQPSQQKAIEKLKTASINYKVRWVNGVDGIELKYRPCDTDRVTQIFGVNPENYIPLGLPGHEGIDWAVEKGLPFYAAQDGVVVYVSDRSPSGGVSNYGWHCYIRHETNGQVFNTLYAHASYPIPVKEGQQVSAGQVVAYSGDTGNSSAYHLHFNVMVPYDTGNGYPVWTYGQCVDPWPYLNRLQPPPVVAPPETRYDMLLYLRGDGRLYEVANADGGQERFQTQVRNSIEMWQTKSDKAEQLFFDTDYVYRGFDTSPGNNRFYIQQEPKGANKARWLPRKMALKEMFSVTLWVQFFNWDCSLSSSNTGQVTDTRIFQNHYKVWTSKAGITLSDVIEIRWINGGETYFYAKNYGLVAWERTHQDPNTPSWSAISEIHEPGQRPNNVVNLPSCLRM